jgi:hypothetical protein
MTNSIEISRRLEDVFAHRTDPSHLVLSTVHIHTSLEEAR